MSFSDILSELMSSNNTSNMTLSKAIGVSDVAILRWRRGDTSPTIDNAVKIAEFFDVSLDTLTGMKANVDITYFSRIPILGDVSAGKMEVSNLLSGEYLTINRDLLNDYPREECYALSVSGDSMEPDYPDRSYIIVHQQQQCRNGDHVVVLDEAIGENTFKIFEQHDDQIELLPLNKKYKKIVYSKQNINRLKIQGVAINCYYRPATL